MNDILERTFYNNSVKDYLLVFGGIIIGLLIVMAFKRVILRRVKKWSENTNTDIDDFLVQTINRFGLPAICVTIVYVGLRYLAMTERVENILIITITVVITFLVIRFISTTLMLLLRSYVRKQENGEEKVKQLGGIMLIINIVIWAIGLLFFFDNMGYDVTAIVAGLGIGGIAIALAAQNILGDLFNYFVIFFDRPFEVGDFLIIDSKMGVVEYIGLKTTRIKSLSGEQLIFANSDLTNSRIHNYKKMQRRRVVFRIGVIYQTLYHLLKQIPDELKSIVEDQEKVQFDRSHFASYGDSSLDFEVVYYVLEPDYNLYMDIQQDINYRILEKFEQMGVDIAYPTRTLFLMNEREEERQEKNTIPFNRCPGAPNE